MKNIAINARSYCARGLFVALLMGLGGCAGQRSVGTPAVYDFGPGPLQTLPSTRIANLPTVVLADLQTSPALDGTAVLYRLTYADAQQLKPYALARWSMPVAQLIRQRLREHLGQRRTVLNPGELLVPAPPRGAAAAVAVAKPAPTLMLRVELEEFSQLFSAPDQSTGLLRLRATVSHSGPGSEAPLAQRSFIVQQAATTPDASGGVRALTAATDQAVQDLGVWLAQVGGAL
jgi:cholesterol transport system auxiliary component